MVEEKSHDCRVSGLLEPGTGADALQLTLRFSFRARLTASVRLLDYFPLRDMRMTAQEASAALLNAVDTLEPLIRQHADEAERHRRLALPVVQALTEAGIFRMCASRLGWAGGATAHLLPGR